jgi:predicted enzyme related to lactoylglutathione lyase
MGESPMPKPGTVSWFDLTVERADEIRDFYSNVTGWRPELVDMDGYSDFCMLPPASDKPQAGICHARGVNTDLPAQWLIYITVGDLESAMGRCRELGGSVIAGPRKLGEGRFCVIRDPAGAVAALYMPTTGTL